LLSFGRLIVLAGMVLALGCTRPMDLTVGDRPESELASLVDSDAARRLLADLLTGHSLDARVSRLSPSAHVVDAADGRNPQARRLLDQSQLRQLGREVSVDFAALAFAHTLLADPRSRRVQTAFDRFLQAGPERSAVALKRERAFPYTLLFAPSWLYQSHPENGSDFAAQRLILDRLGIANRLIASGQSDSVEDNAAVIAQAVRSAGREGGRVILVSASKSGAEAVLALSQLTLEEAAGVVAWINIAGALRGTPLADEALRPPAKWLARGIFWLSRWDWAGLTSLATEPSRRRFATLQVPATITVVNVVAVPVSGSVGYQVYPGYEILLSQGPNDGVVLLADTVWPTGINIVALGADHLFARWREEAYALAIMRAVDVAIRLYGPTPEPPVTAERDGD
jgi:hypothetical protein